jgi:hypothetical protein
MSAIGRILPFERNGNDARGKKAILSAAAGGSLSNETLRSRRGGFDLIAQGMGGIMHVTGEPDGPPTSVGLPICDVGTGM